MEYLLIGTNPTASGYIPFISSYPGSPDLLPNSSPAPTPWTGTPLVQGSNLSHWCKYVHVLAVAAGVP